MESGIVVSSPRPSVTDQATGQATGQEEATPSLEVADRSEEGSPVAEPRSTPDEQAFSVRVPTRRDWMPCVLCAKVFRAVGPTGYLGGSAICDGCLLAGQRQLGMALMMISVCRYYAEAMPRDLLDEERLRHELLAFARVYHRYASAHGKARSWGDFFSEKI